MLALRNMRHPRQGFLAAHNATRFNPSRQRFAPCHVLSESSDMTIGTTAPDFNLLEPKTGKSIQLGQFSKGSPATLVMFLACHCKYVVLYKEEIAALVKLYQGKGVSVIAISSSSIETHPQDGPSNMVGDVDKFGYTFPFLYDESQEVAKAYLAACTPEFYVFDAKLKLTYHGQFDDARPSGDKPVTGKDLRAALDATLAGLPAPTSRPSIGCNIKWAPGKEPSYFGAQVVKK